MAPVEEQPAEETPALTSAPSPPVSLKMPEIGPKSAIQMPADEPVESDSFADPEVQPETVAIEAGDFRIPEEFQNADHYDPFKEIVFSLDEVVELVARGSARIPISRLIELCPEIFRADINSAHVVIYLPWRKLADRADVRERLAHRRELQTKTPEPKIVKPPMEIRARAASPEPPAASPKPLITAPEPAAIVPEEEDFDEDKSNSELLAILASDRQAHKKTVESLQNQLQAALAERNDAQETLEAELQRIEAERAGQAEAVAAVERELDDAQAQLNLSTRRIEKVETDAKARALDLTNTIQILEKKCEDLTIARDAQAREAQDAKQQLEELLQASESGDSRHEALESVLQEHEQTAATLERELAEAEAARAAQLTSLAEAEKQLEELRTALESANARSQELEQARVKAVEEANAAAEEAAQEINQLREELQQAREQHTEEARIASGEAAQEISQLREELQQAREQHAEDARIAAEKAAEPGSEPQEHYAASTTDEHASESTSPTVEPEPVDNSGQWSPPTEIVEADDEFLIRVELSGVDPSDIDLTASGGILSLTVVQIGSAIGPFVQSIRLPDGLNPEEVRADLAEEVLELHLPKTR